MATTSSQDFVPIKEIRDGIVVLKDGTLCGVIMTSSVNFALKSADEQNAIIFQFQNFLNSINFSIQIFSESRRLDIRPYVALLEKVERDQNNELLRIQTREYIEFIKNFTSTVSIMTKSFFVVVPYTPAIIDTKKSGLTALISGRGPSAKEKSENFEENRTQLLQRMEVVIGGLTRVGVRSVPLGTEELVELYYKLFNPGETEKPINITQVI